MRYFRVSFVLFHVLAIIYLAQKPASESDEDRIARLKFKVHVINGFSSNKNPLVIHCYSKDDDLGEHTLWMKGEFKFRFGVGFFRQTRFWCDMAWGSKKKAIDVFNMQAEYHNCLQTGNCYWKTLEDGIYFSNDYSNWLRRYLWPFE